MAIVSETSPEVTVRPSRTARNGLVCALVVAGCIKTAQVFAQTGHFAYNGWTAPMLGWQAIWGALFIKVFGFSFTVVRLSILPIAMATVLLFHAILLRFGINERNAALGALATSFRMVPILRFRGARSARAGSKRLLYSSSLIFFWG